MAEVIAEELSKQGIRNIVMHNVSHTSDSFVIADVFKYKGLIVGCTTYNTQMYPEMEALLSKLASREIKGRYLEMCIRDRILGAHTRLPCSGRTSVTGGSA